VPEAVSRKIVTVSYRSFRGARRPTRGARPKGAGAADEGILISAVFRLAEVAPRLELAQPPGPVFLYLARDNPVDFLRPLESDLPRALGIPKRLIGRVAPRAGQSRGSVSVSAQGWSSLAWLVSR
jgi:hypothetical protein